MQCTDVIPVRVLGVRNEAQKVHVVALVKFVQRRLVALDRGDVLTLRYA